MRRMTMMAAAAGLALAAAGCGGGGGGGVERLSLEDYRAQADAICKDANEQLDALGSPSSIDELPEFMDKGKAVASAQLEKLRALVPPEDIEATVNEAYDLLDQQIAIIDDVKAAAEAKDEAKIQEIIDGGSKLDDQADALAEQVGLKECGNS